MLQKGNRMNFEWFHNCRFGMFVHWGLYSLLEGQWKGMDVPWVSEWVMKKFRIPIREYEQMASRFFPHSFLADKWVKTALEAGMKYMIVTAKHHDGFAMFHSSCDSYNIVDATPYRKDPLESLAESCRKHGLRLGFYYSQDQDWHERGASGNTWDFNPSEKTPEAFQEYLDSKVKGQLRELLTNYGQVSVIWFDTPKSILPEQSRDLCSFVHSLQSECLVSGRVGNGAGDYDSLADNQITGSTSARPSEGLGTMNESWGYKPFDLCYRTSGEILRILCEMASSSTNYLLNVSPGGDGSFPVRQKEILAEIGSFLSRYGEALYGSEGLPILRPFSFLWGGVTRKKGSLYFWIFRRFDSKLFFYGLRSKVHRAWIPGGSEIAFQQEHRAEYDYHKLILYFPDRMPLPCVIRVECDSGDLNEYSYSSANIRKD